MAGKGGNRQQRQAVAAKQNAQRLASSPAGRVAAAAAAPVERCLRLADMADAGIGHVILARRLPTGTLGCGFFLVDIFCLGVKDAFYREMASSELDERLGEMAADGQAMIAIDPASAKAMILGAVAFAADCGMDPARDHRTVFKLFDGIDAEAATETFGFGMDGKPVYVPGPNDGPAKMREIERRLTKARGEDGWDFAPLSKMPERERLAMQGIFDLLERVRADDDAGDGPVIEHEGSTEVEEAAPPRDG